VPGLGPARSRTLLKHFGSLKRLRAASVEEIASVPGMGKRTAAAVVAALARPDSRAPGADAATGGAAAAGGGSGAAAAGAGGPADRTPVVVVEPPGIEDADPGAEPDGPDLPSPRPATADVAGMLGA
jgi:hypothetical protein